MHTYIEVLINSEQIMMSILFISGHPLQEERLLGTLPLLESYAYFELPRQ